MARRAAPGRVVPRMAAISVPIGALGGVRPRSEGRDRPCRRRRACPCCVVGIGPCPATHGTRSRCASRPARRRGATAWLHGDRDRALRHQRADSARNPALGRAPSSSRVGGSAPARVQSMAAAALSARQTAPRTGADAELSATAGTRRPRSRMRVLRSRRLRHAIGAKRTRSGMAARSRGSLASTKSSEKHLTCPDPGQIAQVVEADPRS